VIKLYELSPTPCLYRDVADVQNMVGRVHLMPLFLAGNSTPTIPHIFRVSKRKVLEGELPTVSPRGCASKAGASVGGLPPRRPADGLAACA
jgi:hypothetical protein